MCQDMVAEKERMKEKQIVGLHVQQRAADVFCMRWRTQNKSGGCAARVCLWGFVP